ncbi:hypothetical protein NDU88_001944 [Pleurodeles waltl]|uniref:Uncharacterized protein n=1 Tax=Pleurodeles waltl TaxID=8319 RepID=A0AAV7W0Q5_PLEWA|nr:hypothetical protein NDU88_001944 [Pleurodeles waltl]
MQHCAAVYDRLPRRCATPAQLPHNPIVPVVRHRQLGHMRRWRNPPVYRPLVDLLTMEERHIIVTYRFDRATIQEL